MMWVEGKLNLQRVIYRTKQNRMFLWLKGKIELFYRLVAFTTRYFNTICTSPRRSTSAVEMTVRNVQKLLSYRDTMMGRAVVVVGGGGVPNWVSQIIQIRRGTYYCCRGKYSGRISSRRSNCTWRGGRMMCLGHCSRWTKRQNVIALQNEWRDGGRMWNLIRRRKESVPKNK